MVDVLGESGISCRGIKVGVRGGELGVNGTCAGVCCLRVITSKVSIFCCCYSTISPGMLATDLLRLLFPGPFNADNLRVYSSYFGGGKLKKRSLDHQCKSYLKRYLVTFYTNDSTPEEAYNI
jgi:hypothetical protein